MPSFSGCTRGLSEKPMVSLSAMTHLREICVAGRASHRRIAQRRRVRDLPAALLPWRAPLRFWRRPTWRWRDAARGEEGADLSVHPHELTDFARSQNARALHVLHLSSAPA